MGTIFGWNGFGKEGVEADTDGCEWNGHQEGDDEDRDDLSLFVQELGQKNKGKIADSIDDCRPKDGASGRACFQPATRGNGKEKINSRRYGTEQTDLKAGRTDARGVDGEKADG